jgi:hypothetical protein
MHTSKARGVSTLFLLAALGGCTSDIDIGATTSSETSEAAAPAPAKSCPVAGCLVTTLASGLSDPIGIAVDSARVYWTDGIAGAVLSIPSGGGTASTLAPGQVNPSTIITNGIDVYWIAGAVKSIASGGNDGGVTRVYPSDGNFPNTLAIDETSVYWGAVTLESKQVSTGGVRGVVVRAPLAGGTQTTLASGTFEPTYSMATDSSNLYWTATTNGTGDGVFILMSAPLSGGKATTLLAGPETLSNAPPGAGTPLYIGIAGSSIYGVYDALTRRALDGSSAVTLAPGFGGPLVINGANVYWLSEGKILSVPRSGGDVVTLASGRKRAQSIAVDSTSVYWTEGVEVDVENPETDGRIMKVLKP